MEASMTRLRVFLLAIVAIGGVIRGPQESGTPSANTNATVYGYVSDTHCGCTAVNPDTSKPSHKSCIKECLRKDPALKYSFCREYRQYIIKDQTLASKYAGQMVRLTGDFDDKEGTVAVASMGPQPHDDMYVASLNGWVVDDKCGAKGANSAAEGCTKKCIAAGARMVIVTDGDQKVLSVDNPDALKAHEGHHISMTGHMSGGDSIYVESAKML
jgi:hypothetical protein